MRLIDANVLLKVFKALIGAYRQSEGKHNWGDHCRIPAFEFMDALKSAKTIEAIPLSFIRDEVERLDKCKLTELADYMRNVLKYYDAVQRGEETW